MEKNSDDFILPDIESKAIPNVGSTDGNISSFIANIAYPCQNCTPEEAFLKETVYNLSQASLKPDCTATLNTLFAGFQTVYNESNLIFNGVSEQVENDSLGLAYSIIIFLSVPVIFIFLLLLWHMSNSGSLKFNQIVIILIIFIFIYVIGIYYVYSYISNLNTINDSYDIIGKNLSNLFADLVIFAEASKLNTIARQSYCDSSNSILCSC
jgi:hypothetical protein